MNAGPVKRAAPLAGLEADQPCHRDPARALPDTRATGVWPRGAQVRAWPISEVSRWLGHKSITTTVDLCGHLGPEASGRARDAPDKAFAATRVCPQSAPADS